MVLHVVVCFFQILETATGPRRFQTQLMYARFGPHGWLKKYTILPLLPQLSVGSVCRAPAPFHIFPVLQKTLIILTLVISANFVSAGIDEAGSRHALGARKLQNAYALAVRRWQVVLIQV